MRLIKHKQSNHTTTVSDAEWAVLVEKGWDKGYKVLEHSPDAPKPGQKKSTLFVPPEIKLAQEPAAADKPPAPVKADKPKSQSATSKSNSNKPQQ